MHHEELEAMRPLLLPCAAARGIPARGVVPEGPTPRGQPWTPAVTLPQGGDGLSVRRMAVL